MAGPIERGCFTLDNLLSAQFITQSEACTLVLCSSYFKKGYMKTVYHVMHLYAAEFMRVMNIMR